MEAAIEAGADDVTATTTATPSSAPSKKSARARPLSKRSSDTPDRVKAIWKPNITTAADEDNAEAIMKLIAALDDDDDVQDVYSNVEVDEATMAKLTAA